MSKTITVEIDEQGGSTVDLKGFHGKGCADVLEAFRAGDKLTQERTKSEYFQRQEQTQKAGR